MLSPAPVAVASPDEHRRHENDAPALAPEDPHARGEHAPALPAAAVVGGGKGGEEKEEEEEDGGYSDDGYEDGFEEDG